MTSQASWGRLQVQSTLAALVVVAACSDGIAPLPPDPPPTPYVVNERGVRVFGVTRIPVLPVTFVNGLGPTLSPAVMHQQLFGSRDDGAVTRTYSVASEGRFALRADVAQWKATSKQRGTVPDTFVVAAIEAHDPDVDFGRYDSDGPDGLPNSGDDDGIVDGGIVVLIPELNLTCGVAGGVHPFARIGFGVNAERSAYPTSDASVGGGTIGIRAYTLMGATDCSGTRANPPTLAHELGHVIMPVTDIYHEVVFINAMERWRGRRWIMGCWELMAAGSGWGCGADAPGIPLYGSTFGAWARQFIGWTEPITVDLSGETTHELRAVGRGGDVLAVPMGDQERVLIEYRQSIFGDAMLPADGVIMYHVVDTLPFRPDPAAPRKYRASVIEADGDGALLRITSEGGNRGVAGDAFGNGVNELTPVLHPGAVKADGNLFPFRVHSIVLDRARGRATLKIAPFP